MIKVDDKALLGYKFIDLFCGIGGFHLALNSFGAECVFASDIDKNARTVYVSNFGIEPKGDITKIRNKDIPAHDILCAGFPCQPFSISGNQKGFNDPRGKLFYQIIRIARYHRPKIILLENVKNLKTHNNSQTGEVEKVFERHLANNPWLIEPTWISKAKSVHTQDYYTLLNIDNGDEKKLYTDIIVEVSDEPYPVLIEIKREKATKYSTPDVSQICSQIYNYQKVMSEKLTRELGYTVNALNIKAYFICGQKAFDKLDQNDRNKLNQNGILLRSYDELIRTAKRIFEVNFGEDIEDIN